MPMSTAADGGVPSGAPSPRVDVVCSLPGYASHLIPVWEALPAEHRGLFVAPGWFAHRIPFPTVTSQPREGDILLTAAQRDFSRDLHKRQVHLEHGVGQTYSQAHPAYPGGAKRGRIDLFLCPSERVAEKEGPKAVVVGAPKLDRYHGKGNEAQLGDAPALGKDGRVVALTWHWDANGICPEAGTAFWQYRPFLHDIQRSGFEILGHAHPRMEQNTTPHYEKAGIEVVTDFEEVIERADVLCVDNSSAGPEFAAATGKPLVWINAKEYRRGVNHGQRFWDWVEGQIQCNYPDDLLSSIGFALDDPEPIRAARQEMVEDAYAMLDGRAAERCVQEILKIGRAE